MKRTPERNKDILNFIAGGPEPKVNVSDMAYRDLDGPDESCTMRLARAIHAAESDSCVTSWSAQVRAEAYFNARGLARSLDECVRLEKLRRPTADN